MLVIEITYLGGVVQATDYQNRSRAEWPPHPDRLFSAMVAAVYRSELTDEALDALRWLEKQKPPQISCSESHERADCVVYVPINDPAMAHTSIKGFDSLTNKELDKLVGTYPPMRNRQPRWFPAAVPEIPVVQFIWPEAEPGQEEKQQLNRIAENITYLGSSRTPVCAQISEEAHEPTWIPADAGEKSIRVVGPGRLDELDRLYNLKPRRPPTPGRLQPYMRPVKETKYANGEFGEMLVLRRTGGVQVDGKNVLTLTQSARKAVLSLAGADAPPVLHGHQREPHCAWFGLPFVNHEHADGRVMGLALALPRDLLVADRRSILKVVGQLSRITLPGGHFWKVEAALDDPRRALQTWFWTKPSSIWATISPVLLDHYPKPPNKPEAVEKIIRSSCIKSGLPEPAQVITSAYSPIKGVRPSKKKKISP